MQPPRARYPSSVAIRLVTRLLAAGLIGLPFASGALANPAITPSTVLLAKTCPGVNCDEPCEWTGGPGGDIRGQITIDDSFDIVIAKIETRPLGAAAWQDVTGDFGADPMDGIKAQRTGEIAWEDPFGNDTVSVPCGTYDERIVDVRVTTQHTTSSGTTEVQWVIQVIFRMVCEECNEGGLEPDSSGDQCQPTREYDHTLSNAFSLVNRSGIPRSLTLTLSSDQPWPLDPPLPETLELAPGELVILPASVTVPVGTPSGTTNVLTLLAEDENDPAFNATSALTITVDDACGAAPVSLPLSPVASTLLLGALCAALGAAVLGRGTKAGG